MRVLAVGAHPDDCEFYCMGTLARYIELGHQVTIAVATDGRGGHMVLKPDEVARVREQEARRAARLIGAGFIWLGFTDEFLGDDRETRMRFVDAIREARPDVIITHAPDDYHPDHRATSSIVFNASFVATVPNIPTNHPAHGVVCPLFYMDTPTGKGFIPTDYVDITGTFETKKRALACHESQLTWLKDHDNMDALEWMEIQALARGIQCGARHAEGFRQADTWPRTPAKRLLP